MTQGSARKLHNITLVFSCLNGLNNRFLIFASYVAHLGNNPKPLVSNSGFVTLHLPTTDLTKCLMYNYYIMILQYPKHLGVKITTRKIPCKGEKH